MNYSKGEWKVIASKVAPGSQFYSVVSDYRKHQFEIAKLAPFHQGESETNAHLISAAPDMYEALNEVLWDLKQRAMPDIETVRQALAKAEKKL